MRGGSPLTVRRGLQGRLLRERRPGRRLIPYFLPWEPEPLDEFVLFDVLEPLFELPPAGALPPSLPKPLKLRVLPGPSPFLFVYAIG